MSDQPLALKLLAEDRNLINYRPNFSRLTGSITAAILLQQIFFRWTHHGREPFFKFKEPCSHEKYREGDSWCEELAFSKHEFDSALKKIGTKVTRGKNKTELMEYKWPDLPEDKTTDEYQETWAEAIRHIVIYWTDSDRITWYHFNEVLFNTALHAVYLGKSAFRTYLGKSEKSINLEKPESGDTLSTETTTEKTTEKKDSADTAKPVSAAPEPEEQKAPVETPTPPRTSRDKTLDNIDPLKAVIAFRGFGIKRGQVITGRQMTRINMVAKELRERYQNGSSVHAGELKAAYVWHGDKKIQGKQLSAPRDPVAVATMVQNYRDAIAANAPVEIEPLAPEELDAVIEAQMFGGVS